MYSKSHNCLNNNHSTDWCWNQCNKSIGWAFKLNKKSSLSHLQIYTTRWHNLLLGYIRKSVVFFAQNHVFNCQITKLNASNNMHIFYKVSQSVILWRVHFCEKIVTTRFVSTVSNHNITNYVRNAICPKSVTSANWS